MNYEEYMRSILGCGQMPNNIYANTYNDYYYETPYLRNQNDAVTEMLEGMYPEIYKIVYPMVCKLCDQNTQREITRDLINNMAEEIFVNMEPQNRQNPIITSSRPVLKNGDVRNPNAKESELRGETRQENYMLKDLIKILILRELIRKRRYNRPMPPRQPIPVRPPWGIY